MKKAQKLCRNAAEQLRVAYSDWCHLQQCAIYHNKVFVCGSYYGYFTVQNSTYKCIHKQVAIHKHPFKGPFSRTNRASRYQKSKTNLDFTEARDSEWQWNQLPRNMQVCTALQTDNHASTPPLSFLQAGCPSCRPANSIKALKAIHKKSEK